MVGGSPQRFVVEVGVALGGLHLGVAQLDTGAVTRGSGSKNEDKVRQ
jgi:hypothetical protein